MAKPTVYPDFCVNTDGTDNDVIDPITLQNNVVAPDSTKKLTGWTSDETPPRQHFNWLARLTTQWIRWIDEAIIAINDILSKDVVLTGACPNSTTLGIDLPSGFTNDNLVILGGFLYATSVNPSLFPFNMYRINGTDVSYISVWVDHSPDHILVSWFEGSALKNLNGLSYRVVLRRIS